MRKNNSSGEKDAPILEKEDIWYCSKCGFNLPKHWKFNRCMACGTAREEPVVPRPYAPGTKYGLVSRKLMVIN